MIIHKNPISVETGTVIPEDGEGYEDVIVIDDNSLLAQKVNEYLPYFELVLDDNGDLIDITPIQPPETPPEPSETELLTEYLLDVDFRVAMLELGLI